MTLWERRALHSGPACAGRAGRRRRPAGDPGRHPASRRPSLQIISDVYAQQGWTQNLQDTWRYVIIAGGRVDAVKGWPWFDERWRAAALSDAACSQLAGQLISPADRLPALPGAVP